MSAHIKVTAAAKPMDVHTLRLVDGQPAKGADWVHHTLIPAGHSETFYATDRRAVLIMPPPPGTD